MTQYPIETRVSPEIGTEDHSGASSDLELIELWLAQYRSPHTRRIYTRSSYDFLRSLVDQGKTLRLATLRDLAAWADQQPGNYVSAVKSLLSFGHRTGYLQFNIGVAYRSTKLFDDVAERILTEGEVHRMLFVAQSVAIPVITVLYGTGMRVAELCGLEWQHVHEQDGDEAVLTIHGKGTKTRHVRITKGVYSTIRDWCLPPEGTPITPTMPLFRSRSGKHLDPSWVFKLIQRSARAAGITSNVSPHWLRHAHASHAIERGAPIHLVQATLGHSSIATTGKYLHANPTESSGKYLTL